MPMKRVVMGVAAAAMVLAPAGCANNGPTPVSVKAAKALAPFVTALREAASHDSVAAVQARVSDLDAEVTNLVESSDITQKRGKSIQDAASALESDFKRKNTPTPTPSTSTSTSTSATDSTTPTESPPPKPGPTVTITAPPTDSGSPGPTETETQGNGDGQGNGNGNDNGKGLGGGGFPPGHNK
jgi:hypothetical protein